MSASALKVTVLDHAYWLYTIGKGMYAYWLYTIGKGMYAYWLYTIGKSMLSQICYDKLTLEAAFY